MLLLPLILTPSLAAPLPQGIELEVRLVGVVEAYCRAGLFAGG